MSEAVSPSVEPVPAAPVSAPAVEVEEEYFVAPPGASDFAMWMGVTLIAIMFAAGCIGYGLVRRHTDVHVTMPTVFWLSTFVINVSSALLYYAMHSDRVNHLAAARRAVYATTLLGLVFLILQAPGLQQILAAHRAVVSVGSGVYGVMLMLVLLHAAHMTIGLIFMALLARRLHREPTVSHLSSIRVTSIYWHGMTVIWVVMFSLLACL